MDLQLQDRVALVVGGKGYIGTAVVDRLRQEGATVVVASRTADAPGSVAMDTADQASVDSAVARVLEDHARIDVLVVTAAPAANTLDPERRSDPDQVTAAVDGKALGFLRVANAVLPAQRQAGFGRVVVVSGQNAYLSGNITTSLRNAATNVIAKNLADETAGTGVTVNVVNPGTVTDQPDAEVRPGAGGQSSPQQIADLVAFLSSPLSVVSGESISIAHRVLGSVTV
ncbi:SDR family NAD(P)-dependent oxidoreductase [Curtobacterium sp. MCPF17_047]|uniref:SDR family NAD(P)-dependent oxidoreductase n=1 Tax=unclassified Curtobacterium TaxID=257496 RepID=UPI000DA8E519|nr:MULTISPECIES: SDR family NAD(P)-dependent oxidoreductase [unclassified Curtobacterium]PZE62984.1 SDR family NAD(P)-dependent oxidoreductase [Curtobacterium sp. MCPF17_001]PZF68914.1 SDR family NAD(P)-dependent oxidoreductase [Curtobacterium sp. MCPF17_047]